MALMSEHTGGGPAPAETGWLPDCVYTGEKFEAGLAFFADDLGRITRFSGEPADLAAARRLAGQAALVAWWYGGVLQNLGLVTLPASDAAQSLKEQLLQMAWAGELDGWLSAKPTWHLVTDAVTGAEWEQAIRWGRWFGLSNSVIFIFPVIFMLPATRLRPLLKETEEIYAVITAIICTAKNKSNG